MPIMFDYSEFILSGGMAAREYEAAAQAIRRERESWLPILEAYAASLPEDMPRDELMMRIILDGDIRRLRKLLRLPPPTRTASAETVAKRREQTRERVRRHRQRRREADHPVMTG